jgi:demethylmenaquinone methyltransferase/2-methoxy-6-polyprenyl-1,4-benzoquinol methylase
VIDLAAPAPGARAADLATGTGDIAFALAARGTDVVGLDVTRRMIELAREKRVEPPFPPTREAGQRRRFSGGRSAERRGLGEGGQGRDRGAESPSQHVPQFLVGDMVALPFAAGSFDIVTTGYGLRNVPDLQAAIDEMLRVLKPGGQALSLDFDRPSNPLVRSVYLAYLTMVGGALGWILHRDPDTYRYIPASIRNYPGAAAVARLMEARGFARVRHYRVFGGLMAIHHGFK